MTLRRRTSSADPDGHTVRFHDTDFPSPISSYMGSDIDPDGNGWQVARPMIQIIKDHHERCPHCEEAELEGELIIVE